MSPHEVIRPIESEEVSMKAGARDSCLLCGSADTEYLVTGYDRMRPTAKDYEYSRCRSCGLVFLDPLPQAEEIPSFYHEEYSPHQHPSPAPKSEKLFNRLATRWLYGVASTSRPRALRAAFRLLSGRIMKGTHEPYGANRLLDVGCGAGELLAHYQRLGWSACGIDFSARACGACRQRGLEVYEGTIFDAPLSGRQFDLILMSHVIEHLLDPVAVLARAADLLAPRGKVILETPNIRGIGFSLYGSCWFPLEAPRHIFLFDPQTIRLLGRKAGLRPLKVATESRPRMLCESRHYFEKQGMELPPGLESRKTLLERSVRSKEAYRAYRKLVAPMTALLARLGRGDILRVEFSR
jgi:2-polyprenyl-3-methyl-5-hydroxy-6-metoxy-1,4-benzoquinol methylase